MTSSTSTSEPSAAPASTSSNTDSVTNRDLDTVAQLGVLREQLLVRRERHGHLTVGEQDTCTRTRCALAGSAASNNKSKQDARVSIVTPAASASGT